jgi:hypothetical protein
MVSFMEFKADSRTNQDSGAQAAETDSMDTDELDGATIMDAQDEQANSGGDEADEERTSAQTGRLKTRQQQRRHVRTPNSPSPDKQPPQVSASASLETADGDEPDEEQLKRILACKRLSEGNCSRHLVNLNICRKNSLHMIGESLPPVTEGEPMRHMSQNIESSQSSSASSSSLRGATRLLAGGKRNSQDENATSCSSSTSLDGSAGGFRSPTRRRSSTVSQCSSVLSETARQQLNFDLSPDLPPDSSILEANAISPTDFERPASPEPSSMGSADGSFDMRPVSRMSQCCDELMTEPAGSPDSTLGDSADNTATDNGAGGCGAQLMAGALHQQQKLVAKAGANDDPSAATTTSERLAEFDGQRRAIEHEASIADKLDRIISHVSEVKVSSGTPPPGVTQQQQQQKHLQDEVGRADDQLGLLAGQKRAHTPFGSNIQRNKTTHIEVTD